MSNSLSNSNEICIVFVVVVVAVVIIVVLYILLAPGTVMWHTQLIGRNRPEIALGRPG